MVLFNLIEDPLRNVGIHYLNRPGTPQFTTLDVCNNQFASQSQIKTKKYLTVLLSAVNYQLPISVAETSSQEPHHCQLLYIHT